MAKTKFVNLKFDFSEAELDLKESLVLSYLASLTKRDYCFASNEHLVDTLKISDRTIYRVLNSLEDKELIKRVTNNLGGSYGKNRKIYVHPSAKKAYHSK